MIIRTLNDLQYLTKLPKTAVRVRDLLGVELLSLKKGKRKWTTTNIELRDRLPLLIYSPYKKWWWYRKLGKDHDMNEYRRYIRDGNLYINFDEYWQQVISRERDEEGMGYYDYIKIRSLILLEEHVRSKNPEDASTKLRSISIQINEIKKKYDKES